MKTPVSTERTIMCFSNTRGRKMLLCLFTFCVKWKLPVIVPLFILSKNLHVKISEVFRKNIDTKGNKVVMACPGYNK